MPLQRPTQLAWPYLNPNSPLYQGLVFAGLGPHPGGWDYHDCSPYRNNGRLTDMDPATDWVWVPELGRWGLDFDGTNDYVQCGGAIVNGVPVSLSCWVKMSSVATARTIMGIGTAGAAKDIIRLFYHDFNGITSQQYDGSAAGDAQELAVLVADTWYHIVGTFQANNSRSIWRDGVLRRTNTTAVTALDEQNYTDIGDLNWSGGRIQYFSGQIGDSLIYNRILTLPEISALADPSNAMLAVGNTSLILPPRRRLWPAAVGGTILPQMLQQGLYVGSI